MSPVILFNKKLIMFRAENEILMLSIAKPDYAINKEMLRAVLNGYAIDAKVPCQLNQQQRQMSDILKKMADEYQSGRQGIQEHVLSSDNEEDVVSESQEEVEPSSEEFENASKMIAN
jgi:hypothetical protein